jgi:hypothetical protein
VAVRTRNVDRAAPHVRPCVEALASTVPAARWVVADQLSGLRAAYVLKPDGTRGVKVMDVPTKIDGTPTPCAPRIRATQTTSSVYGLVPHLEGKPLVALCRKAS